MIYRTSEKEEFDISKLSEVEQELFNWIIQEYDSANSWIEFQQRTANATIDTAKRAYGAKWGNHPLYKIQLDLVKNKGIKTGRFKGELSDMLL